jgi:hypothetical protein
MLEPSQSIREKPVPPAPNGGDTDVDISPDVETPPSTRILIEGPDGSVSVSIGGGLGGPRKRISDQEFSANLAESLSELELGKLASDLLDGIEQDDMSRRDWLEQRAEGMKLLGTTIERPSNTSGMGSAGGGVDGTSRTRHSTLLEMNLRFQATARGELLPSEGPVKVEGAMSADTIEGDKEAQDLEDGMNYFITTVATEYYPDTDRMFFMTGFGGCMFKKVYRCPIRRRPVAESVDPVDLIVSNHVTDIQNADRITHRIMMLQSTMKRMQYLGVYLDVNLGQPSVAELNAVDQEKQDITGITVSMRPEDQPFEILECFCQTDVPGDEHMEGGEITGLPRPYKVTIDKSSRKILEIRRNWEKGDELEARLQIFVKYSFVPAFGFYDLGLLHIAGNLAVAATAILRIMIDSGIYSNFPGGLAAKSTMKQNTTDISVPPGGFAPIDTSMIPDGDIRKAVMSLPYQQPGPALFQLLEELGAAAGRLGGAAEIAVGEGKQDAPVGTTIALIEQAAVVMNAVHKRMHAAQAREFELLRDLFVEYPADFWRFSKGKIGDWNTARLLKALNNYAITPRSDPNTSSSIQRIMRAQAVYMMAEAHPELWQISVVQEWICRAINVKNPQNLMAPPAAPQPPPPDPKAEAAMISAQAQQVTANAKMADVQQRGRILSQQEANDAANRNTDLTLETMKLKSDQLIHGAKFEQETAEATKDRAHEAGLAMAAHAVQRSSQAQQQPAQPAKQ